MIPILCTAHGCEMEVHEVNVVNGYIVLTLKCPSCKQVEVISFKIWREEHDLQNRQPSPTTDL